MALNKKEQARKDLLKLLRDKLKVGEPVRVTGYHTGDFTGICKFAGFTFATITVAETPHPELVGLDVDIPYSNLISFEEVAR